MKAQGPGQSPCPATTTTKVKRYSAMWVGWRHGFPPVSREQEEQSWRVIRWGTEYAATLVELATSDGFFVGILLPNGQALIEGDLFLFETRSEMLLARVERNYPIRYTCRLVRFRQPVPIENVQFRWAHQDGLLTGKEGAFRITRHAPVAAQTEEEALGRFARMEPHTIQDIVGSEDKLVLAQCDVEQAKWTVQKDTHGHAIRALERLEESGKDDTSLTGEVAKQFAIDVMARTGLRLHPIEQLTPTQRKSLARRCHKVKNVALRHLVLNYLRLGYDKLYSDELAQAICHATGVKMTPAAVTKARERQGLTTQAAGRPPSG